MRKHRRVKFIFAAALLLIGMTTAFLWSRGARPGHIRFLVQTLSQAPELSAQETTELHRWLRNSAVHLETVAPGSGFEDLQPLKAMIGDARIVALGEAAHCNRDFNRVKHRLVEFLVNEMDFRMVAFEATFAGALELDNYLQTGQGTPEEALAALVYPAWRIEAVLDLITWMRQYNATHDRKICLRGFDNKPATGSAEAVQDYLSQPL